MLAWQLRRSITISEDTGDEVKEKLKASKDGRGQCQNKAKHSMKK